MPAIRRLAAILAADVAGYSRLMGADEEGTLERLKALCRELVDPKIAEHKGRIPGLLTRGPDHRRRPAGVRAIIRDRSQRRTPALRLRRARSRNLPLISANRRGGRKP
jgi:class 3 adenylate cyclase